MPLGPGIGLLLILVSTGYVARAVALRWWHGRPPGHAAAPRQGTRS